MMMVQGLRTFSLLLVCVLYVCAPVWADDTVPSEVAASECEKGLSNLVANYLDKVWAGRGLPLVLRDAPPPENEPARPLLGLFTEHTPAAPDLDPRSKLLGGLFSEHLPGPAPAPKDPRPSLLHGLFSTVPVESVKKPESPFNIEGWTQYITGRLTMPRGKRLAAGEPAYEFTPSRFWNENVAPVVRALDLVQVPVRKASTILGGRWETRISDAGTTTTYTPGRAYDFTPGRLVGKVWDNVTHYIFPENWTQDILWRPASRYLGTSYFTEGLKPEHAGLKVGDRGFFLGEGKGREAEVHEIADGRITFKIPGREYEFTPFQAIYHQVIEKNTRAATAALGFKPKEPTFIFRFAYEIAKWGVLMKAFESQWRPYIDNIALHTVEKMSGQIQTDYRLVQILNCLRIKPDGTEMTEAEARRKNCVDTQGNLMMFTELEARMAMLEVVGWNQVYYEYMATKYSKADPAERRRELLGWPLFSHVARMAKGIKEEPGYLFTQPTGRPLSDSQIDKLLEFNHTYQHKFEALTALMTGDDSPQAVMVKKSEYMTRLKEEVRSDDFNRGLVLIYLQNNPDGLKALQANPATRALVDNMEKDPFALLPHIKDTPTSVFTKGEINWRIGENEKWKTKYLEWGELGIVPLALDTQTRTYSTNPLTLQMVQDETLDELAYQYKQRKAASKK